MKKTIIALMALGGMAAADTITLDLATLNANSSGKLIGGGSNSAEVATEAFSNTTSFLELQDILTTNDTWYVIPNSNTGVNTTDNQGVPAHNSGASLVAGGPAGQGYSAIGGIKFTLTATEVAQFDGSLTFSFEAARWHGNNNQNHAITFSLLSKNETLSATYNSKTGDNLLSTNIDSPTKIKLTFSADQVEAMKATGEDQTFFFIAASDEIHGSNTGILMNHFQMEGEGQLVPEPTTATLSLLALAGLAVRRRRK